MLFRIFAAVLVAGTAHAACPTGSDVAGGGVWLTTDDGGVTHFQRDAGGDIMEITLFDDGTGVWVHSRNGAFVVEDGSVTGGKRDPGGRTLYEYATDLDSLPLPGRNAQWEGELRRILGDTGAAEVETVSYRAVHKQTLVIGNCDYCAVLYRTEYVRPDGDGYVTELHFIPDLDISLLAGGGFPGQPLDVSYSYLKLTAERP